MKENNKSNSRFAVPKQPLRRNKSRLNKSDTPATGLSAVGDFSEPVAKLEKDGDRLLMAQTPVNLAQEAVQLQKQSAEGLMSLLRIVGKALLHLSCYESRSALEVMEWLSARHKRSSWILSLMAKAYFELADYKQASK